MKTKPKSKQNIRNLGTGGTPCNGVFGSDRIFRRHDRTKREPQCYLSGARGTPRRRDLTQQNPAEDISFDPTRTLKLTLSGKNKLS